MFMAEKQPFTHPTRPWTLCLKYCTDWTTALLVTERQAHTHTYTGTVAPLTTINSFLPHRYTCVDRKKQAFPYVDPFAKSGLHQRGTFFFADINRKVKNVEGLRCPLKTHLFSESELSLSPCLFLSLHSFC